MIGPGIKTARRVCRFLLNQIFPGFIKPVGEEAGDFEARSPVKITAITCIADAAHTAKSLAELNLIAEPLIIHR